MRIAVDIAYKSLNKSTEILCSDKVEILKTDDSNVLILADGIGNSVGANILSMLTSKILRTMFLNGVTLDECVEIIVETLPACQMRQVAYFIFSISQVFHNGEVYLVEFDNPGCTFIRDGKLITIPENTRVIEGKTINEPRFQIKGGGTLILMSGGAVHVGVGRLLNFGWLREGITNYVMRQCALTVSVIRLATSICHACGELYMFRPRDGTTVVALWVINNKPVHLMMGSVSNPEGDKKMVSEFMSGENTKRIVCRGTSATIVSRKLNRKLDMSLNCVGPDIPPIAYMDGIELMTEGVLTLNRVLYLLKRYVKSESVEEDFFLELDKPNGGSMVAKMIIGDCTELHLCIGRAVSSAYQNLGLPFDLGIRQNLMEQLKRAVEEMGKTVIVVYY